MVDRNHKPPSGLQTLATRAAVHLGAAPVLIDLVLDGEIPEPAVGQLQTVQTEITAAQDCVRTIAGPVDRADAEIGMAWWNGLSKRERAQALEAAGTSVPAEAWAHWKRSHGGVETGGVPHDLLRRLGLARDPSDAVPAPRVLPRSATAPLDEAAEAARCDRLAQGRYRAPADRDRGAHLVVYR